LKPAAEYINDARQFAQADNFPGWKIGNMASSVKREQMVFAKAVDFDVFNDDHLVIVGFKDSAVNDPFHV
jgi:hypothetical protein